MKLLSKKEIIQSKKNEVDEVSLRLMSEVTDLENKIRGLKAQHKLEIQRNREESEKEFKELSDKKSGLLNEIRTLEAKRLKELEPLDSLKEVLDLKEKELIEQEVKLKERKEKVEIGIAFIKGEKEELFRKSNQLSKLDESLQERKQIIEKSETSLADRVRKFEKEKKRQNDRIENKTLEINEKEKDLVMREKELEIKNEQLEKEKTILNNERKHLESQQASLRAAFEELKKR